MRVLAQRVSQASVKVDGRLQGEIGLGLLLFVGISRSDTREIADYCAEKLLGLRVFSDEAGKMNRSVGEAGGALLVISQFTLYGDCRKGRRPSFSEAAPPDDAFALYNYFVDALKRSPVHVETGVFQATMEVSLINQGPVTLWIDSADRIRK
jgi:D-tyrosyl-tRNA(Tyr) deacylase